MSSLGLIDVGRILTNAELYNIVTKPVANLSAVGCQLKYRDKAGGIVVTGESASESGDKGKIWPQ